jgi:glycosyltransferase involved in cell wall biosynthesis
MNQTQSMKTVTVIIPTCDRPEGLSRCLTSIQNQTYQPQEIVVVNDGRAEINLDGVRVVKTAGYLGSAAARNLGVDNSVTELVAFIDDDCVADEYWLENLVGAMREGDGFGFGKTIYREQNYQGHFPERLVHNSDGRWPGGANLIFDRQTFNRLAGFDSKFWEYRNEDTELAIRAVSRGVRYVRAREAVVYHRESWWTVRTLLASAKNVSVWVILKQQYPTTYWEFGTPVMGAVVAPGDYGFLILLPLIFPFALVWLALLVRYWWLGGRDLGLFFAKWPVWLLLRRWWIWREAWRRRVVMI